MRVTEEVWGPRPVTTLLGMSGKEEGEWRTGLETEEKGVKGRRSRTRSRIQGTHTSGGYDTVETYGKGFLSSLRMRVNPDRSDTTISTTPLVLPVRVETLHLGLPSLGFRVGSVWRQRESVTGDERRDTTRRRPPPDVAFGVGDLLRERDIKVPLRRLGPSAPAPHISLGRGVRFTRYVPKRIEKGRGGPSGETRRLPSSEQGVVDGEGPSRIGGTNVSFSTPHLLRR